MAKSRGRGPHYRLRLAPRPGLVALASIAALLLLATLPATTRPAGPSARVGVFHVGEDHVPASLHGLLEGLKTLGYDVSASRFPHASTVLEGKTVRIDWRNLASEEAARIAAREFVADRVDLIVAVESQAARAAKSATSTIPVVFLNLSDAVGEGFVQTLSRPGGNFTGVGEFRGELLAKRVAMLTELVPQLRRILVLLDPRDPVSRRELAELRKANVGRKLEFVERELRERAEIDRAVRPTGQAEVEGLFVLGRLVTDFMRVIVPLASARHLALATHHRAWAEEGAFFSYGPDFRAMGQEAARYVDKILKGAKPPDLPVQQATKLELILNLKTARALGVVVPPALLLRADHVLN